MKIKLDCPHAYHGELTRIHCEIQKGEFCPFQFYKSCKGWWVNSPLAAKCLVREQKQNENVNSNPVHGNSADSNG